MATTLTQYRWPIVSPVTVVLVSVGATYVEIDGTYCPDFPTITLNQSRGEPLSAGIVHDTVTAWPARTDDAGAGASGADAARLGDAEATSTAVKTLPTTNDTKVLRII